MTPADETPAPATPPRAAAPRGNPGPRRALARVRPLASDADLEAVAAAEAADPGQSAEEPSAVGGRDVLIPDGGHDPAPAKRSKARGAGGTAPAVPSVAELMPKAEVAGSRRDAGAGARPVPVEPVAHPSPPHVRDVRPVPRAPKPVSGGSKGGSKGGKGAAKGDKHVEIVVVLSKGLRKRLRERADELGVTPEQAVSQLVEVWVDG